MDWRNAQLGGQVGPGWEPIVDELHAKMLALDPGLRVDQVKEKFGGLRYYYTPHAAPDYTLSPVVREYEALCARTCEWCGSIENVTTKGSWAKTLCPDCRQKWDNGERWWGGWQKEAPPK